MTFDIIAVCCAFPPIDDIELFIENEKKVATPADIGRIHLSGCAKSLIQRKG